MTYRLGVTAALIAAGCSFADLDGYTSTEGNAASAPDGGVTADGSPVVKDDGGQPPVTRDDSGNPVPSEPTFVKEVRADRPVAYFRLEEAPGSISVVDAIAQRTAFIRGEASTGDVGAFGRGVALDGGEIDLGDVFDFTGKVPFAFEMWIKPKKLNGDQHFIYKRKDENGLKGYIGYFSGDGTAHFEGWGVGLSAWTNAPVANLDTVFHHVVISVSYVDGKGNAFLYVDGQRAPNGGYDNTENLPDTDQPLLIGSGLRGILDEVVIYDHALTEDRIVKHFVAGKP